MATSKASTTECFLSIILQKDKVQHSSRVHLQRGKQFMVTAGERWLNSIKVVLCLLVVWLAVRMFTYV